MYTVQTSIHIVDRIMKFVKEYKTGDTKRAQYFDGMKWF